MGNQMTEMLKGTLEGIVLAILAVRPAYGYEITARLREQGFSDLAEGTVYALLVRIEQRGFVDVEKVPSEKGPPRKVYSINAQGQGQLDEFWRTWSFLAERIEQLHDTEQDDGADATSADPTKERTDMAAKWIEILTGSLEQKKQYKQDKARIDALPEPYARPPRRCTGISCTPAASPTATRSSRCSATSPTCGSAPQSTAPRCATSSATTRSSSPRRSPRPTAASIGSTRSARA